MTDTTPAHDPRLRPLPHIPRPDRCHLWGLETIAPDDFDFELVRPLSEDPVQHLERDLFRCRRCGQMYFHETYEVVDFEGGDDKLYETFIPVSTEADAVQLAPKTPFELLYYFPRLQHDNNKPPWWNGR